MEFDMSHRDIVQEYCGQCISELRALSTAVDDVQLLDRKDADYIVSGLLDISNVINELYHSMKGE